MVKFKKKYYRNITVLPNYPVNVKLCNEESDYNNWKIFNWHYTNRNQTSPVQGVDMVRL